MNKIGIVFPTGRQDAAEYARRAGTLLQKEGVQVLYEPEEPQIIPDSVPMSPENQPEMILSLGGDGTLLRAVKYALEPDVPVLGINLGHMGFLTETEPRAMEFAIQEVLAGEYSLEERAMLLSSLEQGGSWPALNDTVITRAGNARLITMKVFVDGEEAARYMSDGLIICTPTGSTGYSLSAGGPIVSPHVHCMVITPVCAHSLVNRSMVVHGRAKVRVEMQDDAEMTAMLQVDGKNCAVLHSGNVVEVHRPEKRAKLVRLHDLRFFSLVRHKLQEWS